PAVDHDGIRVWRLDALDKCLEHRTTWADHALGRVHNALNGVLDIRRRKRLPIVPVDALVEVEGDGFPGIAHVPGLRLLRDLLLAFRIVGAGADQAVIGWG